MPFTESICKSIMNNFFGNLETFPNYTNLYLALLTGDPEALTGEAYNTEDKLNAAIAAMELQPDTAVGNGYKRVWIIDKKDTEWPVYFAPAGNDPSTDADTKNDAALIEKIGEAYKRGTYNEKEIHFNKAKTAWGDIKGFAIYSAETAGTLVYYAKLDNPITVGVDEIAMFDPGELIISFATKDADVESST